MSIELNTDIQSAKGADRQHSKRSMKAGPSRLASPTVVVSPATFAGGPFDTNARRELIAEMAYRLAAQRGFVPGHELDDWLAAEREVDERLCGETHPF